MIPTLHECPAPGCGKRIRTTLLMCSRHWFQVPASARKAVHDAWSQYQDGTISLDALRVVQANAIRLVKPQADTVPPPNDETVKGGGS